MSNDMNHVDRFRAVMAFQPVDRIPRWEWAMWWDGQKGSVQTSSRVECGATDRLMIQET